MIRPFLPLIRPLGRHRLLVAGVRGLRAAGRHPARRIVLEVIGGGQSVIGRCYLGGISVFE